MPGKDTIKDLKERLGLGRPANGGPKVATGDEPSPQPDIDLKSILDDMPPEVRDKAQKLADATGLSLEDMILNLARGSLRDLGGEERIFTQVPDAEDVKPMLMALGTAYQNELRPYLGLAKGAAPAVAKEAAEVIAIIFDGILDACEGIKTQRARNHADTAWSRKSKLDAYVQAGFSRDEAFAMVLAEVKPPDYSSLRKSLESSDKARKNAGE